MIFLKFLLIVFIIFYVLMLVGRLLLKRFIIKSRTQYNSDSAQNNARKTKREGETYVDFQPQEKKQIPNDEGDYVDYEEIK